MTDPVCCMKSKYANSLPDGWDRFSRFLLALVDTTRRKFPTEDMGVAPELLNAAFSR